MSISHNIHIVSGVIVKTYILCFGEFLSSIRCASYFTTPYF